jgi:hypothetical protein
LRDDAAKTACLYGVHAVMRRALRTEWDGRDEPVVEVAAPEDFSGEDFLDRPPPLSAVESMIRFGTWS